MQQMGWTSKRSGLDQTCIQTCPFCHNTNFKFYISDSGLFDCKVCPESGNLYQLKQKLGISVEGVMSMKDSIPIGTQPSPLPNFPGLHWRLMNDKSMEDVLDYLVATRKFSIEVIEKQMIGADTFYSKETSQKIKCYVIPYFDAAGVPVFFKARSIPPNREFFAPSGRQAPLYNGAIVKPGLEELILCEGEADCISVLSQGYETVVGVPGANVQKAEWIAKLDKAAPKDIYILFDRDKVGQQAAHELAKRIGIDKVKNILLPEFDGKDINDWFAAGHTLDELRELMAAAKKFDVAGVKGVSEILNELEDDVDGFGNAPTYDTPWPSLTSKLGGGEPGDVIGIIAEGKVGKTSTALNWLHHYSMQGHPTMMFCLEMLPKRLVRKWVCHVTQTDDTIGKSDFGKHTVVAAKEVVKQMPADILFGYSSTHKPDEIYDTIRQAVRRYGVKVLCFDNLQFLVSNVQHSTQETSKISKDFKRLAMELGILILLIIQPNRVAEGQIVAARNANGSSAIEKDVDAMVCLHRNRVMQMRASDFRGVVETEENLEPHMLVRVDLSRYAPGGITTLYMDGAKSTVRELQPEDLNLPPTTPCGGNIPVEGDAI